VVEQPEEPPGKAWHRQGYVELAQRVGAKGAWQALNFPDVKGKKSEHFHHVEPRQGTKAQAAAYCCSTWFWSTCHVGDHADQKLAIWDYSGTPDGSTCAKPSDEEPSPKPFLHTGCSGFKLKHKAGPSRSSGSPNEEGRTGKNSGGKGQGDQQAQIIESIRAGKQRAEIFEAFGGYCARYHAWVNSAITLYAPQRCWKPHVVWLWGDAGVNKSRMAKAVCSDSTYHKSPDSKWWDGYSGQHVVVLDDLRKSTFTFGHLLVLLDRFSCQVEFKGGMTPLLAKVVVVTCSRPHDVLWRELGGTENENLRQLTRRLDTELHVTRDNVEEQKRVVFQMRAAVQRLKDPANWDGEDPIFGTWDSSTPLVHPMFQKRPRPEGEPASSSSPAPKRPEHEDRSRSPRRTLHRLTTAELEAAGIVEASDEPPSPTEDFDPHEAKRNFERKLAEVASGSE
jgi:hypothetical protein